MDSTADSATDERPVCNRLQQETEFAAPPRESGPNGSDPERQVRAALDALQQQPARDAAGRFVAGTLAAGDTLERSAQLWAAVEPAKRELVERLRADLAVDDGTATTFTGLLDAYAEARLLRHAMFLRLVDLGGPVTTKGKARSLYRAYLGALDRELKLAQALGLERRARHLDPMAAVHAAVAEANR